MGLFDFIKTAFSGSGNEHGQYFHELIEAGYKEMTAKGQQYWWSLKASDSEVFTKKTMTLDDKQKVQFICDAVLYVSNFFINNKTFASDDKKYKLLNIAETYMRHLLKAKLVLNDEDIKTLLQTFAANQRTAYHAHILHWPVNLLVNQVEKQHREKSISDDLRQVLNSLLGLLKEEKHIYDEKERTKVIEKIETMLFNAGEQSSGVKPTFFPGDDEFGKYANETINSMKEADRQNWFKLMLHVKKTSGSKPSKKFMEESKNLFREFGADKFKQQVNDWFLFLAFMKERTEEHVTQYADQNFVYTSTEYLTGVNSDMLKGFVWSCVHFHDKSTLFNIAKLADRTFRKIPGKGPAAAAVGNACLFTLANSKGLDGVGHLSRLKLRIKQSSTQALIEKYLQEAATAQGVSIHEIEDMAVDDYGLQDAKNEYDFDGYKAVLEISGVGKTNLNWFKPDGSLQKAVPSIIKTKYAAKLKKLKETIKQIELMVGAQRDRLDRTFKTNRTLSGSKFNEFYFNHGLMCYLAKKIIWIVEKEGKKETVFYLDEKWRNINAEEIIIELNDDVNISLWHPVYASVEDIKSWRAFMMQHKIVQPLKQAYREVYLLTDAEINTVSYSNRMAAHILKQHQFNSLAKIRGWKYSLIGAYDGGANESMASIELKDFGLRAEFWVNEVNADDAFNDTGIWLYIATDQVRFTQLDNGHVKELIEVPAIILSEILRDVDLFVGVASVGNDPNWRDSGGLPAYRDYWQSYSFGDLNEVAKTRKSILEGLLPRLKIAKIAELKDKFLIVKGNLRTYKIHIGSTNILMEPNDQYLCIVPDRGKKEMPDNVFLPFEGDNGLSVILSKAMLLADDDKITDKTITSQINRK